MADPVDEFESAALRLPTDARARLAERLLSSLEPESDADAEALWLTEAERRLDAIEQGRVRTIPADDVIAEMRSRLR